MKNESMMAVVGLCFHTGVGQLDPVESGTVGRRIVEIVGPPNVTLGSVITTVGHTHTLGLLRKQRCLVGRAVELNGRRKVGGAFE